MAEVVPNIDYTSRDYDGLRTSLLAYAQQAFPQWTPASEGDFGVLMVELLAYMGDVLSYYADRAQNEAYLATATQRASVLNIAKLLGYKPGTGTPAKGSVILKSASGSPEILVPAGTQLATAYIDTIDGPIIFETDTEVAVPADGGTASVNVTEGQTINDPTSGGPTLLATGTGYPDQTYQLSHPNVYQDTVQIYVDGVLWQPIDHLLDAQSFDRVYSVDVDANGYTWITFGDGNNGAVPPLGVDITTTYRIGYGSKGNLPKGSIVSVYNPIPGLSLEMIDGATSSYPDPTTGGADPESTEQIRTNAPVAFNTQQRAVTLDDFAAFALSVPGVAKAAATADYFSSVTVYVVGPDGGTPTDTLLDRVYKTLQQRTLAGVTVNVEAPNFVKINVGIDGQPVTAEVWPNYSRVTVLNNIEQAIKTWLSFSNMDLGYRLTVAELYSVIMDVEGVRYVSIPVMVRDDAAQSGTSDIQLKPLEFPVPNDIVVTTTGGIEG